MPIPGGHASFGRVLGKVQNKKPAGDDFLFCQRMGKDGLVVLRQRAAT